MTATVKLYNKGKRTITGEHQDIIDPKTGAPKRFSFAKETSGEFSKDVADRLRRLFPSEIVSLEDVKRQFDEPKKEAAPATISVEEANRLRDEAVAAAVAEAVEAERNRALAAAIETPGIPKKAAEEAPAAAGKGKDDAPAAAGAEKEQTPEEAAEISKLLARAGKGKAGK